MTANQADLPVRALCKTLRVSHSGFCDWLERVPSASAQANAQLVQRIAQAHQVSDATDGMPRIHAELSEQGVLAGRNRSAGLMRRHGLRGVSRRRGWCVTTQRDKDSLPAPDLVQRRFEASGINPLSVADMACIPTCAGFGHPAVVLDVFSRKIVGWAFRPRQTADLVIAALNMALITRKPHRAIHHCDRGSQYTRLDFGKRCKEMGVRPSMGSQWAAWAACAAWAAPATTQWPSASSPAWNVN